MVACLCMCILPFVGGKSPDLEAKCDIQYNTIQVGNSESNSITMIPNPSYGMLSPVV